MGDRGVAFGHETARRIVDKTRQDEATPTDRTGQAARRDLLPRDYREFELAEELSGGKGSTAAVKWLWWHVDSEDFIDSSETGEVYDHTGNAYGLEGEIGDARFLGGKWVINRNPGRPVYDVTASGDISAGSSTGDFTATIDGTSRTVEASIPSGAIPTGKKIASGTAGFVSNSGGTFHLISLAECRDDA